MKQYETRINSSGQCKQSFSTAKQVVEKHLRKWCASAGITGMTGISQYSLLLYSCDRPYSNALAQAVTKPRLAAVALPPKTWPPKLWDRGLSGAVASKRKGPGQKGPTINCWKRSWIQYEVACERESRHACDINDLDWDMNLEIIEWTLKVGFVQLVVIWASGLRRWQLLQSHHAKFCAFSFLVLQP